jgi:hypothetical protein
LILGPNIFIDKTFKILGIDWNKNLLIVPFNPPELTSATQNENKAIASIPR